MTNYNLTVNSKYNSTKKNVTYTFTLDQNAVQKIEVKYGFKKKSTAYSIMRNLPGSYQTLIFNKNEKEISTGPFVVEGNNKIIQDQQLDIRIIQGQLNKINGKKFKNGIFDFSTKIL